MSRLERTGLLVAAVIIGASLPGGAQATTYDLTSCTKRRRRGQRLR
jgi:hypothetical protein